MATIAIIDHATHQLFIEEIDNEILEQYYNGDEQKYIDDNYEFEGDYSWDYITEVVSFNENNACIPTEEGNLFGVPYYY